MPVVLEKRTRFTDELRLIPMWARILAVAGFLLAQYLLLVVVPRQPSPPPQPLRMFLGPLVGFVLACYVLLIGYVNGDSGRRGMSRLLWTAVAVFVPNGLGIVIYLILRQPLLGGCPQCGNSVQCGFNFCPCCSAKLHPLCPHCQREVQLADKFCSFCGQTLPATEQQPTAR